MKIGTVPATALSLGAVAVFLCGTVRTAAAETSWDRLVAAAKTEGKVVLMAPPDTELRRDIPQVFRARFGIKVDYIAGRGRTNAKRIRTERRAGLYTADVVIAGLSTLAIVYYREKMLEPLRPALVLPEVVDGSKWKKGKLWFSDPDGRYILRISNQVQRSFYINTSKIKPGTFRKAADLLDPRWKGKIAMDDPRLSGSGLTLASRFYLTHDEAFIKKLYVDQKPKFTRSRRQLTDWLMRGTYPITFGADDDEVVKLRKQGFPLMEVDNVLDLPATLSAGYGEVALLNRAPHPNAAKVFVNWLASKEGLETYARARGEVPTRNDIDERSFLPPEAIPKPGVKYIDTYDWDYVVKTRSKVRRRIRKLLAK